jgi:hypothetical protein
MKTDLTDVTFLILVRLDSVERLENILCVTERLTYYFKTNVTVREADSYNNGILKSLLNRQVQYEFVEDEDPVLYRTRHINQMAASVTTPCLAIWDADIIPDKKAMIGCMEQLRSKEADVAYPYNGICYDVPKSLKSLYFERRDIRLLFRHVSKMDKLYPHALVGGAVIIDKERYIKAGMENEKHYGWGNDDFDRYYRFVGFGYSIHRVNTLLFHLGHPRGGNSRFRSSISNKTSSAVRCGTESSSMQEIQKDIRDNMKKGSSRTIAKL